MCKTENNKLIQFIKDNTFYDTLYWYPLTHLKNDIPVVAYKIDDLYKENMIDSIKEVLVACGIKTVKTFQTDYMTLLKNDNIIDLLYEKDKDGYNFPWYVETFYYDKSQKWMIYVSHEGTITFTGESIVKIAKRIIPERYLYKT